MEPGNAEASVHLYRIRRIWNVLDYSGEQYLIGDPVYYRHSHHIVIT